MGVSQFRDPGIDHLIDVTRYCMVPAGLRSVIGIRFGLLIVACGNHRNHDLQAFSDPKPRKLVSGKNLHDAVHALGLTRYSIDDINEMAAWRDWERVCSYHDCSCCGSIRNQQGCLGCLAFETEVSGGHNMA